MSETYEAAMIAFQDHLDRAEDGSFVLTIKDGREIGIFDPVVFADLKRSLDETNRKIRLGQIDPELVNRYAP